MYYNIKSQDDYYQLVRKAQISIKHTVSIMAADGLAMQEARVSAAMVQLTNKYNAKNILVRAPEGLHISSYGNFWGEVQQEDVTYHHSTKEMHTMHKYSLTHWVLNKQASLGQMAFQTYSCKEYLCFVSNFRCLYPLGSN